MIVDFRSIDGYMRQEFVFPDDAALPCVGDRVCRLPKDDPDAQLLDYVVEAREFSFYEGGAGSTMIPCHVRILLRREPKVNA